MIKLLAGQYYQIKQIKPKLEPNFRRKLLALGFIPGAKILLKRIAPLGDPIQIEINGFSLSLRRQELIHAFTLEAAS